MTGLNEEGLILLFSLFCHLLLQNISGDHYVLGAFTCFISHPQDNTESWNFYSHFYVGTETHGVQGKWPKDTHSVVKDLDTFLCLEGLMFSIFYYIIFFKKILLDIY